MIGDSRCFNLDHSSSQFVMRCVRDGSRGCLSAPEALPTYQPGSSERLTATAGCLTERPPLRCTAASLPFSVYLPTAYRSLLSPHSHGRTRRGVPNSVRHRTNTWGALVALYFSHSRETTAAFDLIAVTIHSFGACIPLINMHLMIIRR